MSPSPDAHIWRELEKFLSGEMPLDELESWVDQSPDLELVLSANEYLALIELDYRSPRAVRDAEMLVSTIYDAHRPGVLALDRAERIARGMLTAEINIAAGSRALARMHLAGHAWIPHAFVGIASGFDDVPTARAYPLSDPRTLADRLATLRDTERQYRAPSLVAARRLLEHLAEIEPRRISD